MMATGPTVAGLIRVLQNERAYRLMTRHRGRKG
jgi:hypothetical protein